MPTVKTHKNMTGYTAKEWLFLTSALYSLLFFATPAWAQTAPATNALPQGGSVVAGQATIGQAGAQMTVNQSTSSAVINWSRFDVGAQAGVNFVQPDASSRTLNRVMSSDPSRIYGHVSANGQLYFVNPNGVIVGPNGRMDAGSVVVSTMDITNDDFMSGTNRFVRGSATGTVQNQGTIAAAPEGYVALVGAKIENSGTVSAPKGKVVMAAGDTVVMPVTSSGLINLEMDPATVQASITNDSTGVISAPDGQVYIRAEAAGNLGAQTVNKGRIEAQTTRITGGPLFIDAGSTITSARTDVDVSVLTGSGTIQTLGDLGEIRLKAGYLSLAGAIKADGANGGRAGRVIMQADSMAMMSSTSSVTANGPTGGSISIDVTRGSAILSGKVEAKGANGTGGTVQLGGSTALALLGAQIDASGTSGGGTIAIGGGWQGVGDVRRADSLYVDQASLLRADGTVLGSGGEITLWSNKDTSFFGQIFAQGGLSGGNGGRAEISSSGTVNIKLSTTRGVTLTARKAGSSAGTLLVDPADVVIGDATDPFQVFKALLSPNGAKDAFYGASIALTDDYALIGAPGGLLDASGFIPSQLNGLNYGNAYLYRFSNSTWTDLSATTGQPVTALDKSALFGFSLALNNNYALIGAPGYASSRGTAYLYNLSTGAWTNMSSLAGEPATALANNSLFGWAVALNSTMAAIAASGAVNNRGAVWLYGLGSGTWTDLEATAGSPVSALVDNDMFGTRLAMTDTHLLIGAAGVQSNRGNAYLYNLTNGAWLDLATTASEPISALGNSSYFGTSVALTGDTALIGAPGYGSMDGNAWFYDLNTGAWTDLTTVPGSMNASPGWNGMFGCDVALTDDYALIGAVGDESARGSAFLINRHTGVWTRLLETTDSPEILLSDMSLFGTDVALNSTRALIGAPGYGTLYGAVFSYNLADGAWTGFGNSNHAVSIPVSPPYSGPTVEDDSYFGRAVALNADYALIGAEGAASSQGNAYLYKLSDGTWTDLSTTAGQPITALGGFVFFGKAVALNSTYALIGLGSSQGNAYLYNLTNGAWTDLGTTAGSPVLTLDAGSGFGQTLTLSEDYALIGASSVHDQRGNAFLYKLSDGTWVDLAATAGEPVTALADYSSFGASLAINQDYALIGALGADLNRGTAYLYKLSDGTWLDLASTAGEPVTGLGADSFFGRAVALNSTYALIGTPGVANYRGTAYLYNLTNGAWTDLSTTPGEMVTALPDSSAFGESVAMGETWAAISAVSYPTVFLYKLSDGTWRDIGATIQSPLVVDSFSRIGESIAINDAYVLLGAYQSYENRGNAYLYEIGTGVWTNLLPLARSGPSQGLPSYFDGWGSATAVNDTYAFIGAPFQSNLRGNGWLYNLANGTWTDLSTTAGQPITALSSGSLFGGSGDLSNDYLVIGTNLFLGAQIINGLNMTHAGGAYLYNLHTGAWTSLAATAGAPAGAATSGFGFDVAINGAYAAVSSVSIDGTGINGAYLYNLHNGSWTDLTAVAGTPTTTLGINDYFGWNVALNNDYIAVTNVRMTVGGGGGTTMEGNVYLYHLTNGTWTDVGTSIGLPLGSGAMLGINMAMNSKYLLLGSWPFGGNSSLGLYDIANGTYADLLATAGVPITGITGFGLAMNEGWAMTGEATDDGSGGVTADIDSHFYNLRTGEWRSLSTYTGSKVKGNEITLFVGASDMGERYAVIGMPYLPVSLFGGGGGMDYAGLFSGSKTYILDADYVLKTVITTADVAAGLAGGNFVISADNSLTIHHLGLTNADPLSALTLYSGGRILIDGTTSFGGRDVTIYANAANAYLGNPAQRYEGAADFVVTADAAISNNGAYTFFGISTSGVSGRAGTFAESGDFILDGTFTGGSLRIKGLESVVDFGGSYTLTGAGTAAIIEGLSLDFTGGSWTTSSGRWLAYNTDAASLGSVVGVTGRSFNRYGCTIDAGCAADVTIPLTGNGVVYAFAPTVTITGQGALTKTYDGGYTVTVTGATLSGLVNGDTPTLVATFASKDIGTGIPVTYALSPHMGYLLAGGLGFGDITAAPTVVVVPTTQNIQRQATEGLGGFERSVSAYDLYALDLRTFGLNNEALQKSTSVMLLPMQKLGMGLPLLSAVAYNNSGLIQIESVSGADGQLPDHLSYDSRHGRLQSRNLMRVDRVELAVRDRQDRTLPVEGIVVPVFADRR